MWFVSNGPINIFRQNGSNFPDDIFKYIFLNEKVWISITIPLRFVPKSPINNILALVQIMAWCRPGNKPLSEPMMASLLMHICTTGPQWVNNKPVSVQIKTNHPIAFTTAVLTGATRASIPPSLIYPTQIIPSWWEIPQPLHQLHVLIRLSAVCFPRDRPNHALSAALEWDSCQIRLTHWGLNKMSDTLQTTYHYLDRNILYFDLDITEVCAIDDKTTLAQAMAWHLKGAKPLPEPMLTQIYDAMWCHWATMS